MYVHNEKEYFNEYCLWLFDILFEVQKQVNISDYPPYQSRLFGFLAERLTTLFIIHKKRTNNSIKIKHLPVAWIKYPEEDEELLPAFEEKACNILLSVNFYYLPYLSVCLESLLDNINPNRNYDIIIFETNVPSYYQELFKKNYTKDNVSIRFYRILENSLSSGKDYLKHYKHYQTIESMIRIIIPKVLKHHDKAVYIDADTLLRGDIAELYDVDLKGNPIGACRDLVMTTEVSKKPHIADYIINTLELNSTKDYFQAGVLVMNLREMEKYEEISLKYIADGKMYLFDQCALNATYKGKVHYLDPEWNYDWNANVLDGGITFSNRFMPMSAYKIYKDLDQTAKIIHYAGYRKPWNLLVGHNELDKDLSLIEIWWKYARKSTYYEELWFRVNSQFYFSNLPRKFQKQKKLKLLFYKIMYSITYGKLRNRLKEKYYKNRKK